MILAAILTRRAVNTVANVTTVSKGMPRTRGSETDPESSSLVQLDLAAIHTAMCMSCRGVAAKGPRGCGAAERRAAATRGVCITLWVAAGRHWAASSRPDWALAVMIGEG